MRIQNDVKGFTLVELLIAMGISSVVIAAIYTVFLAQQSSYYAQDQTAMLQQNLRGGINLLAQEARLAGYDITTKSGASITVATKDTLRFTHDLDGDEDVDTGEGEDIRYYRYEDSNNIWCLGRSVDNADPRAVAENIERLEFYYTMKDGSQTLTPGNLDNIRAVQVSILARAAKPDRKFTSTRSYVSASGVTWPAANDNYRRRLMITTVQFRNMGL